MKRSFILIIFIICLGLVGCGGKFGYVKKDEQQQIDLSLSDNESGVVFFVSPSDFYFHPKILIPFSFSHINYAPVYDIDKDNEIKFVTALLPSNKFFYKTTPGEHIFATGYPDAKISFMKANLEKNKIYYIEIDRLSGMNTTFDIKLLKNPDKELSKSFNSSFSYAWIVNTQEGINNFSLVQENVKGLVNKELLK